MSNCWTGSEFKPLPKAKLYIVSENRFLEDKFKGKKILYVSPCQSFEEANKLYEYVRGRKDQKNTKIVVYPLKPKFEVIYHLMLQWRNLAGLKKRRIL